MPSAKRSREPRSRESVRVIHPTDLPGVEALHVSKADRLWTVFHTMYSFCSIRDSGKGHNEWSCRGKTHEGWTGRTMLVQPGDLHVTRKITSPGDFEVLQIDEVRVKQAAREMGFSTGALNLKTNQTDSPVLFEALGAMHKSLTGDSTTLERQSRLEYCLSILLLEHMEKTPLSPSTSEAGAVRKAKDLLNDRWSENVTLDELSGVSGLSRYHLLRCFKEETGLPPHAYQVMIRVARVREFLKAGMSVAEASSRAGFADQAHCCRHFKRVLNVSPSSYRRGADRGEPEA